MITTELSNIQGLISANAKLSTGLDFLRLMRSEGLLEARKGYFPAICGGAVRDGLFLGREINDIDIFLFRDNRSPLAVDNPSTSAAVAQDMRDIQQDFLAWLEDMEIPHQSLLSDRASAYFGAQRFLDIIQFVWNEVTIQVMIPLGNTLSNGIDNLLRTMPIWSGCCLTMQYLRMFDTTLSHYYLPENHFFVATDRDIPYLRHKAPDGVMVPVNTAREAVMLTLSQYMNTTTLDAMRVNDAVVMNSNNTNGLVRRAAADKLGITEAQVNQMSGTPVNSL